jgi:peptide chain release factor subunit 1
MFDPRLAAKVVVTLDVCYGFENGLNQAIELAQESISSFFEEINMDSGLVVYGIKDTMKLLETGSIRKIVCNEGKFFANVAL